MEDIYPISYHDINISREMYKKKKIDNISQASPIAAMGNHLSYFIFD